MTLTACVYCPYCGYVLKTWPCVTICTVELWEFRPYIVCPMCGDVELTFRLSLQDTPNFVQEGQYLGGKRIEREI